METEIIINERTYRVINNGFDPNMINSTPGVSLTIKDDAGKNVCRYLPFNEHLPNKFSFDREFYIQCQPQKLKNIMSKILDYLDLSDVHTTNC